MKANRTAYIPIDDRDPASVRAVILARSSDPSAKAEDMREQVLQCQEFIAEMRWTLTFEPFTEAKTGMRNVARPVLEEVLRLAARGEIDVIVCKAMECVARTKGRRYQVIETALDYGVEFRFVEFKQHNGKMPDDPGMRMWIAFKEEFGEFEAEQIADRLMPAKRRRYEEGLPHGGRSGPLYGYAPGERRMGKHGKPMGLLNWVVDEEEAQWVRWLYARVDATDPADFSLRGLTAELERRGVRTCSGIGRWSAKQVRRILRNPKYAGLGRALRWQTEHVQERDRETNIVREVTHMHDRMADDIRWQTETFPISTDVIPAIIDVEQWQRVQDTLDAARALTDKAFTNRGLPPRRTDEMANSTLLDGGYVRCAECNGRLTRYWHSRARHPFYTCHKNTGQPSHPHKGFQVPAHRVDDLALRLLAKALTNPEKILELANAAEQQAADATIDAELAASALAAYRKRLAEIANQQDELLTAQAALSRVPDMDAQIADIRRKLVQLDQEREQAQLESTQASPRHDVAHERAEFLRGLFMQRDFILNWATNEVEFAGGPALDIGPTIAFSHAAHLLNMTEDELRATRIPVIGPHEGIPDLDVETEHVLYLLLRRSPRERVRKLLRDLNAVILVRRGRTRADFLTQGAIPLTERVQLQLLGAVHVRTDVANVTRLARPVSNSSSAACCPARPMW